MSCERYEDGRKAVAAWLTLPELELFRAIAQANNVSPSAYLRAMIVDVLAEEGPRTAIQRRVIAPDIFALFHEEVQA